jgi:NAD(P)-dependent dehydrogenase (short-subunit alcohol dehydrogenase family)
MADPAVLAGAHILITGGGSGIGFACAARFRADGAVVTLMGRNAAKLDAAAQKLREGNGPEVRVSSGDVAHEDDVAAAVKMAVDGSGRLHGCVAAAGTGALGPIMDTTLEQWDAVLATNLTGTMLTIKHAARAMRAGGGAIVAISSIAGVLTHRWMTPYCVSKAGIEMLVRNAADELGGAGIRVNAVRPGLVPTDLAAPLVNNPAVNADYLDQMPLRRLGATEDIANIVRFLIGPESSWVTGQVISSDGGHTVRRGPDLDAAAGLLFKADQQHPWRGGTE